MANVVYVTCRTLERTSCASGYFHIASVGWVKDDGQSGNTNRQGMVDWLEQSGNEAYSRAANGQEAKIHVMRCGDHKYIETYADSTKTDNLRELRSC